MPRFAKLASPLLYKSGLYSRSWRRRAAESPFTIVLIYHRIIDDQVAPGHAFPIERGTRAGVFEAQLRFMLRHFSPIAASRILDPGNERMRFAITLDDGYEDNYRVAAPILRRLGIPATFFVVSDFVGTDRRFWWEKVAEILHRTDAETLDLDEVLPGSRMASSPLGLGTPQAREYAYERLTTAMREDHYDAIPEVLERLTARLGISAREEGRDYAMMNWRQLRELTRQGFEIGGHTATHSNLEKVYDAASLEREVVGSHALIERELEAPVRSFAYPYGHYASLPKSVTTALAKSGCPIAFTALKGVVEDGLNPFELPRTTLNRRYDFACAFNVQDTLSASANRKDAAAGGCPS